MFTRSGTAWSQEAYVKASNPAAGDLFGDSLALSAGGSTLAVGAPGEDSAAAGIGGDQADNSAGDAGALYVFTRGGTTWSQEAYVKASNPAAGDRFGDSFALSTGGSTLAVGAYWEDSAATGIGGDQTNNAAGFAGAVYVYPWPVQQALIESSGHAGDTSSGALDTRGRRSAMRPAMRSRSYGSVATE